MQGCVGLYLSNGTQIGTRFGYILLNIPYISDARVAPCFEQHRSPNAKGDKARSPVPAILKAGSAGERRDGLIEESAHLRVVWSRIMTIGQGVELGHIDFHRTVEKHFQQIITLFHDALYVASPFAVHIVGRQYMLMVQIDIGIGVEPLEDERLIGGCKFIGCRLEVCFIHPVFFVNPLH